MDPNQAGDYEGHIRDLLSRVYRLEKTLESHGIVLREGTETTADDSNLRRATEALSPLDRRIEDESTYEQVAVDTNSTPESSAPPLASPQKEEPSSGRSLESRIGSQWFNRIGILAMLIGMAWFLKFAIDNHWIGPVGRVLIGLGSGAGLVAWSERFRHRGYTAFSYSLKAVGSGVLYLSLWAAFSLFHLIPSGVAFAAMILVTAFNGFMAWAQDAELLALYAIVGGLSTPLLISTGENHEIALFSYLLILNIAVLVLVVLRPWSRLLFGAFIGTVLIFAGWWVGYYSSGQGRVTAFFLGCFFLIFAFAPRLIRVSGHDTAQFSRWDGLVMVLMPIANASLGFIAFYAIVDDAGSDWAAAWLAVAFAAFYLMLLRFPARGVLQGSPTVLSGLHLASAVVFLTISLPLKMHGWWLTIGWLMEGAALLWVAIRVHATLLRILAQLCLLLGLVALLLVDQPASTTPFFNQRFGTYCVAIAAFSFTAWLASRAKDEDSPHNLLTWPTFAAASMLLVNALILLALGWEIHNYWWSVRWQADLTVANTYRMYAQFTYSGLFMAFGAVLLGIGFWRRSAFVRWQALVLLAVAIGKVFLVDVAQLSQGFRIVSFLGLGVLLLAVSFIYQRDWLKLRDTEHHT